MRLWGLFCLCPFLTGSRKSRDSPPSRGEGGREERGRRNQPIAARFRVGQWETTGPGLLRHMTATRRRAGGVFKARWRAAPSSARCGGSGGCVGAGGAPCSSREPGGEGLLHYRQDTGQPRSSPSTPPAWENTSRQEDETPARLHT